MDFQPIIISSVAPKPGEIPIFKSIHKCSIFRPVLLKIDKRPQTNFLFQMFIIFYYWKEYKKKCEKTPRILYWARNLFKNT